MHKIIRPIVLLVVAVATTAVSVAEQTDMKAQRSRAAHRHRRIVFDNDGNEPVYYCKTATKKALLDRRTSALVGSQVDTIVYCTWSSGFSMFTHNTKIGEVFTCTAPEKGKGPDTGFANNKTADFIAQGTDPLKIMVQWCREHHREIFWSMRMNDTHDAWNAWYSPHLFPKLKQEHPDWLLGSKTKRPVNGTWSAVDYGRPEIRDLAFRFFQEVCRNYDVDGVEMDFFRHLSYFRSPAWGKPATKEELDMMTDLVRRIRVMADQEAVKKGHPILLSVRLPDSAGLCRAMGFDIERWLREGLIDMMVVSGYFRLNPWETSVALGHRYNVPVFSCLSETRLRDRAAAKLRQTLKCYRGRAMNAWAAGIDSIYMFNFFNPHSSLWREVGDPKVLAPLAKVYTTGARGDTELDFWWDGGEKFLNRDLLNPAHPRTVTPGKPAIVKLRVGEELDNRTVRLRLRLKDRESAKDLAVRINDHALTAGGMEGVWTHYSVTPDWVIKGTNRFRFNLPTATAASATLLDLALDVGAQE